MDIFLNLFVNLSPLYVLIALGFIAGRFLGVQRDSLARVAIFICMPVVMFGFVAQMDFKPDYLLLMGVMFAINMVVGSSMWRLGQKIYPDKRANLLSMCTADGNTGYMGLPIVLMMFDAQLVAVYMMMSLAQVIYEATYNYYVAARSEFTVRKSIDKLLRFPLMYATVLGIVFNLSGFELPNLFDTYWGYFKGAYVVLGMMIIGLALSASSRFVVEPLFLGLTFFGKFVYAPVLAGAFIVLDMYVLELFSADIYTLIAIYALVPTAANIAAFAAQFNVIPEKAASTILIGTIFALFYIPAMLVIFGLY